MSRARLEHHARPMPVGPHGLNNIPMGVIKIEKNIAGVALLSIGQKIYVIAVTIAFAQKAYQLPGIQSRSPGASRWAAAVNQANEVELTAHRRQLRRTTCEVMKNPRSDTELVTRIREWARVLGTYNEFSVNDNTPNCVSQPRDALQNSS